MSWIIPLLITVILIGEACYESFFAMDFEHAFDVPIAIFISMIAWLIWALIA